MEHAERPEDIHEETGWQSLFRDWSSWVEKLLIRAAIALVVLFIVAQTSLAVPALRPLLVAVEREMGQLAD